MKVRQELSEADSTQEGCVVPLAVALAPDTSYKCCTHGLLYFKEPTYATALKYSTYELRAVYHGVCSMSYSTVRATCYGFTVVCGLQLCQELCTTVSTAVGHLHGHGRSYRSSYINTKYSTYG